MLGSIWAAVLLWNVITFATYGWDKWRSTKEKRRVPERTLLLMLFATGWLGAWLAMSMFRHKTRKQPFRGLAILWTVLNPFWGLCYWTVRELAA